MNKPIKNKRPIELLNGNRFDVLFKYLYGLSLERSLDTDYYHKMYRHHLEVWNNFSENDNAGKSSFESYDSSFQELLQDVKAHGFDSERSSVPVSDDKYLLNGAHRLAACLVYNEKISCRPGTNVVDGQLDCSYYFFRQLKQYGALDKSLADRAALEYAKLKPKSRIVTLYPSATRFGRIDEVLAILKKHCQIVYEKSVKLNQLGAVNLMRELYYKEPWAEPNGGAGYAHKAGLCFQVKGLFKRIAPMRVFLVEFEDLNASVRAKEEIRTLYNIEKHSVHINDTYEETLRLVKCLFNKNSIHFLNHFNGQFYPLFEELLQELTEWINSHGLDSDDYCVSAGSVLSVYGLKECKDIDCLHDGEFPKGNELISSHNEYGLGRYHASRDDIIFNPDNHFYRYGIKYASLDVVRLLKQKRGEKKDKRDLKLIKTLK